MSVSRIQELDIDSRSLVTGIYGLSAMQDEFYVDKDLCGYHLWQELYLYLHEKGYITLFCNTADNLFSYQESDLEIFLHPDKVSNAGKRQAPSSQPSSHPRHKRCRGPLGTAHPRRSSIDNASYSNAAIPSTQHTSEQENILDLHSHHPDVQPGGDRGRGMFYQTRSSRPDLFDRCFRYADDFPNRKLVVVFTTPKPLELQMSQNRTLYDMIQSFALGGSRAGILLRFLVLFPVTNTKDLFEYVEKNMPGMKNLFYPKTLFRICRPGMDEIGNVLNKRRIEDNGLNGLFNIPFEVVCRYFWQDFPLRDQHGRKIIDPNTKRERSIESVIEFMQLPKEMLEFTLLEMGKVEEFSMELLTRALSRIHGQQDSMAIIARKVCTWVKRPDEKKTPLVFMLAGTSGTGKTFTWETVSETLRSYGYLPVKLPMNEYKSEADTWKLLGSSVGFVGSEEDAPLFAARKKSERLVILFDEMEKAHESIFETIMTLMEKGVLTNGRGEAFDFKQSIIFFTTNLAMNELLERKKELKSAGETLDSYTFQQSIKDILRNNRVKAEVCGRINTVLIYNTLTKETVARIAIEEIRGLGKIYNRSINNIAKSILQEIINQTAESKEGARPIKELVSNKFEFIFQQ